VEKYDTAGKATYENIIWYVHFAYWITEATNIWLHECRSVLHYTCIVFLVCEV